MSFHTRSDGWIAGGRSLWRWPRHVLPLDRPWARNRQRRLWGFARRQSHRLSQHRTARRVSESATYQI